MSSVPNPMDDSTTSDGLYNHKLSQSRRNALDMMNGLHDTGVNTDIDLPQIAVIGGQSAGKSSLIEAISGITPPRARKELALGASSSLLIFFFDLINPPSSCPTECRLSHSSDPWKCIVELRLIADKNGQTLGQAQSVTFGEPIHDKSEVEERIRRAQRAILNPSTPAQTFLEGDADGQTREISFSTNFISLQISGPQVGDLSFVDLPGLIASVSSEGIESDIEMVKSLVTSYIEKPSCVILLTVACETDFENQGAHHLAKKYDPQGKRTVGVLTKPDRIPTGEENAWLALIRNEREALKNYWYCVKQPSSEDIRQGVNWEEARRREKDFFSMNAPWKGLDQLYKKRLGTDNLVERLSSILSALILRRLPEIQKELASAIIKTRSDLAKLPKPPSKDPVGEVAGLLHGFATALDKVIEGIPQAGGLLQVIRPAQEQFRREIRNTAPDFRPFKQEDERLEEDVSFSYPQFLNNEEREVSGDVVIVSTPIYINQVMERALAARTRELPGHYPFFVNRFFIGEFTAKWAEPAQVLCDSIYATLWEHVRNLISQHFSSFGQGLLEQAIMFHMQTYMKQRAEAAESLIAKFIALEADGAFTLNEHYLADYKAKFLSYYKGARERTQNPRLASAVEGYNPQTKPSPGPFGAPVVDCISPIMSNLANIGLNGVKVEDLMRLLPPDQMDPALDIMADVRAYFQVAYKCVTDNIPAAIDHELVRGVGRGVLQMLYTGLEMNGAKSEQKCRDFAEESFAVREQREGLERKLERLRMGERQLRQVGV